MAGNIYHQWNGTVLTITSDSGVSSCDLKGEKGDDGCRGPQGRTGLTVGDDGIIDTSGLATEEFVNYEINKTKEYVDTELSNIDLSACADEIVADETAAMLNITDAAANGCRSLITHIEPNQSGSGEPSPDNVRPIIGWDSVKAYRTGKNLFNTAWEAGYIKDNNGENLMINPPTVYWRTGLIPICGNFVISDSLKYATSHFCIYYYDANYTYLGFTKYYGTFSGKPITTMNDTRYIRIAIEAKKSISDISEIIVNTQIEYGSTATPYEPYEGQTLTAELPETVYGGSLDWYSGVLTVDWKFVDLGDYYWGYMDTYGVFYNTSILEAEYDFPYDDMVCSAYKTSTAKQTEHMEDKSIWSMNYAFSPKNIVIKDTAYTDASELKASLAGVKLAYKTKTPYTIQLTPQQLITLKKGLNNVWSNTGDTTIQYKADTKLYIDKRFNELTNAIISLGGNI